MTIPDQHSIQKPEERWIYQESFPRLYSSVIVVLVILSVAGFITITAMLWNFTADDAFITFRYAENVVKGWGLTYNQAPPRAEGYTSILWTLIMVLPHWMGMDAVFFSKLVGVVLMAGSLGVMAHGIFVTSGSGSLKNRFLSVAFAFVLFLTFPYAPTHAVSGMETALAAFLYTLTAVLFLRTQNDGMPTALLPLFCLFLGLTRPESNLYSIILLIIALFYKPTVDRWKFAVWCLIFYILPGSVYFIWRYHYYGNYFPLPFYIKSAGINLSGLGPVLAFIVDLSIGFAYPLFIFSISAPLKKSSIILPILCLFVYFATIDHIMGYGHRYFFPILPVLSLLSGLGLSMTLESQAGPRIKTAFLLCALLAFALGFVKTYQAAGTYLSYARGMESAHILLGRALALAPWRSAPVIAIADAGAVPYYSELETVDTFGLNNPIVARNFHGDRSAYVLSQDPSVVILISKYENSFDSPFSYENMLFRSCIKQGFTRHVTFVFQKNYYLWVIWRPILQDADILEAVLKRASEHSHEMNR